LRSADVARRAVDLLDAQRAPVPCSSASFSSSRSSRCCRSPDVRDQRSGRLVVELDAELRCARDEPARQLARLDVALLGDARHRLDRLAQGCRDL
jgi:hypothetical protein